MLERTNPPKKTFTQGTMKAHENAANLQKFAKLKKKETSFLVHALIIPERNQKIVQPTTWFIWYSSLNS